MNDEIEKIIAKFKGDLSGNFEEILQEIAKEAYIKGRKERTVTVSEIVSIKQLAEILGVNISRANAIVKKAHKEMGIGFQLGKSWFILESEIDLIRPGKTGKPPSAYNIKLKINEELKKNISNKVDSIISET